MFIEKWWGVFFGGTDDTCTLMDYFNKDSTLEYTLAQIFRDFNLSMQAKPDGFRLTEAVGCFDEDGIDQHDICMAIDLITDLAVIVLECFHSGSVEIASLDDSCQNQKEIVIRADKDELSYLINILRDFAENPLEYDLAEMCPEEDMKEMANQCKEVIRELEAYK